MIIINKVLLIGRICNPIELRYTNSNIEVVTLNLAVKRDYKSQFGEYETDFINVAVYKNLAKNIFEYCEKGDKVAIEGSWRTSVYQDKDGNNRTSSTVVANKVEFIETAKKQQKEKEEEKQEKFDYTDEEGYELPFE